MIGTLTKRLKKILAWRLSESTKVLLYHVWQALYDYRLSVLPVEYQSDVENIFHCTVNKAGSQWIRAILYDPVVYRYSGLKPYFPRVKGVETRSYWECSYAQGFMLRRIITPVYIMYDKFRVMPKPEKFKAFFVMRDPRDITVSYYFSLAYTHTPIGDVPKKRRILNDLDLKRGLIWTIQHLKEIGLYDALRSWRFAAKEDSRILVVRLEDLSGPNKVEVFGNLFEHCDIRLPEAELKALLDRYSFEVMKKRDHRQAKNISHYRSGKPGDWRKYFDNEVANAFKQYTEDLVEYLGYD